MKKFIFLFLLIAAGVNAQPGFPAIEQYRLSNGLKVRLIEYGQVPAVSISLFVKCGKRNETPGMQELAQLAVMNIYFGNSKYNRNELENKLFSMGTSISALAGDSYTTIEAGFTNNNLDEGLTLFSEAVLHPSFPEKDITQIIALMTEHGNVSKLDVDMLARVFSNFWVYGPANPMGRFFYKDQLAKITPAVMKEFYEFNFTPANSELVICGRFEKEKLKSLIEKCFGTWAAPYGEVNGASFENPVIKKKEYAFINRPNTSQTALSWVKTGPDPHSKESLVFQVANIAFNKMLMKQVREKGGKTYGIGSSYDDYSSSNLVNIYTQVRAEETINTINLVNTTLQSFYSTGITKLEMEDAKKTLRNTWLAIESPDAVISFFNPIIYPKPETRRNYIQEIDKITLEDVNKAIKKYLDPNSYKLMIAGDQTLVGEQLKQLPALKIFTPKDIEVNE